MTGRHRQQHTTGVQRALAGAVPVLGLAGMVTAVGATGPAPAPDAAGRTIDLEESGPGRVAVAQEVPEGTPAVTGVAAQAADASRRAAADRGAENREVGATVEEVRADARERDAAAAREGRQQLDAFRTDLAAQEQQRPDDGGPAPAPEDPASCDLDGAPRLGEQADPHEIVDRDCGLVDLFGPDGSADPWIQGQMQAASADGDAQGDGQDLGDRLRESFGN